MRDNLFPLPFVIQYNWCVAASFENFAISMLRNQLFLLHLSLIMAKAVRHNIETCPIYPVPNELSHSPGWCIATLCGNFPNLYCGNSCSCRALSFTTAYVLRHLVETFAVSPIAHYALSNSTQLTPCDIMWKFAEFILQDQLYILRFLFNTAEVLQYLGHNFAVGPVFPSALCHLTLLKCCSIKWNLPNLYNARPAYCIFCLIFPFFGVPWILFKCMTLRLLSSSMLYRQHRLDLCK
jgi:hypothetical protein